MTIHGRYSRPDSSTFCDQDSDGLTTLPGPVFWQVPLKVEHRGKVCQTCYLVFWKTLIFEGPTGELMIFDSQLFMANRLN